MQWYCPNTSAFDFVIVDKCNKIHAIQVTVQTAAKKCNDSDFFKTENIHFTYLLAPYEVDVNAVKLKSKLYDAYVAYGKWSQFSNSERIEYFSIWRRSHLKICLGVD